MLLEFDVVIAVCNELESRGYTIRQKLQTTQRGDDIQAIKQTLSTRELFIEAKGETSSQKTSKRFGRPFDAAQIRTHVAEALFKAASTLSRKHSGTEIKAGIALPNTDRHRATVDAIQPVLNQLGIAIFWVHQSGGVEVISNWHI